MKWQYTLYNKTYIHTEKTWYCKFKSWEIADWTSSKTIACLSPSQSSSSGLNSDTSCPMGISDLSGGSDTFWVGTQSGLLPSPWHILKQNRLFDILHSQFHHSGTPFLMQDQEVHKKAQRKSHQLLSFVWESAESAKDLQMQKTQCRETIQN